MIVALLWLTISIPFVYAAQQEQQQSGFIVLDDLTADDDQSCNPYGNNTEEKAPTGGSSLSEEYLHQTNELFHNAELFLSYHPVHTVSEYVAFHGEMLCPPPNTLS